MTFQEITLSRWKWRDAADSNLTGDTTAPTNIHLDLIAAKAITDPFIGQNEADVQWVHYRTWVYSTTFDAEPTQESDSLDLVFDGLDTFATVKLNGTEILKSDNMFLSHRIDVKDTIQATKNELVIIFEPAYVIAERLRAERGHRVCWNGHYGRVYVRKAQYHFGWDWGPSLVTCGPWKSVRLQQYTARVEEIKVNTSVSSDLRSADLTVEVAIVTTLPQSTLDIELIDYEGKTLENKKAKAGLITFHVKDPDLWFPHTHGKQPLYRIKATILSNTNQVLHSKVQTLGIRTIILIQSPLDEGSTFYFTCNNIPMFMGGSNWIPGDNFLPRMRPDRYARWIDLVIRGNQNMLRVWGGGIYEDEAFYNECDRRGILVWQDFAFACGQYPSEPKFIQSVKQEATQAIKRLRSHPSLAIWAGNNEDYQIANEGLGHVMKMPKSEWANSTFGARLTYEEILPGLVEEHSPGTIYWPGSPFGGVDNNSDKTVGDIHIWNVSSGMLLPYQRYPDAAGRFVSEFGMLSCPSLHTVKETFFGDQEDHHPQSKAFEFHIKATSHEKRMLTCMGENFRISTDLDAYLYLTQLTQSEAMYYAYRGWRSLFEGRRCGGALVWQTNDSWPTVSWSVIDHFERPKMAYYAIARAMKPLTTGISRRLKVNPRPNLQHEAFVAGKTKADAANVLAHATPHIYPKEESTYRVWVVNSGIHAVDVNVRIRFLSIATALETHPKIENHVLAKGIGTSEVHSGVIPRTEPTVVVSEVFDQSDELLAYDMDWPQPLKHVTFPDRGLVVEANGQDVAITTKRPVKGLFFTNDKVRWEDNGFDVAPGQTIRVVADGLEEEPRWIFYGMNDKL